MEKSGWNDGDGLGAARQGATEHVSLLFKDDNRGQKGLKLCRFLFFKFGKRSCRLFAQ